MHNIDVIAINPNPNFNLILNFDLWPFNPENISRLGYPKIIPYTKFEHFGIIRFWVMREASNNSQIEGLEHPTHADRWVGVSNNNYRIWE